MSKEQKRAHLALQGGGAHGAFTWGILDKILEDGRINIDGICATSAGSINAVILAQGRMQGGYDGARKALHDFWYDLSLSTQLFNNNLPFPFKNLFKKWYYNIFDAFSHIISPYQFNPTNYNLLKNLLEKHVDFEQLKNCQQSNLFISTTNVKTGKPRIFNNTELSIDVVLASACLPYVFHAVQVEEEYYWDGGYMGNPAIWPLFYHDDTRDVIIVHLNPIVRPKLPTSANEIMNRINEITFNSSLLKEMRSIAFVNKLVDEEWLKDEYKHKLRPVLVHSIRADQALYDFDISTKFNIDWDFLINLRNLGRIEGEKWLSQHFKAIGNYSSVDIRKEFL